MPNEEGFFVDVAPETGNHMVHKSPTQDPLQGQPSEAQATTEVADPGPQPREVPAHMSPEHVYGMATYHQSRADKVEAQLKQLRQEMEAITTANPIAAMVARDPALLQTVLGSVQGGQAGEYGAAGAQSQTPSPQKPTPPQRPANLEPYSEEAIAYAQALTDYQVALGEYNEQVVSSQVNRLQQAERQRTQLEEQQRMIMGTQQRAMYEFGLSQQEAQAFTQFAADPSSLSDMGLWINAYKLRSAQQGQPQGQPQGQRLPGQPMQQGQATPADLARRQMTATAAPGASGAPAAAGSDFFIQNTGPQQLW